MNGGQEKGGEKSFTTIIGHCCRISLQMEETIPRDKRS